MFISPLCYKRMQKQLSSRPSLVFVNFKASDQKILKIWVVECIFSLVFLLDRMCQGGDVLQSLEHCCKLIDTVVRPFPCHELKDNTAQRPDITLWADLRFFSIGFWRHVPGCPCWFYLYCALFQCPYWYPEISNFEDLFVSRHENVLRLNVSMNDLILM